MMLYNNSRLLYDNSQNRVIIQQNTLSIGSLCTTNKIGVEMDIKCNIFFRE